MRLLIFFENVNAHLMPIYINLFVAGLAALKHILTAQINVYWHEMSFFIQGIFNFSFLIFN